MTSYVISRGKHPSLSKVLYYFFISFVFICLCPITDRVNTTPSKRINTLWIIVIDTALAPALGLATSYKTNLLSREDRQILTFQHLPYLLLNILLVVYIYITICLCTSDPFICGGGFFKSMSVFLFVFGGTSTQNAPPKCKEHFDRCWFFSHPHVFQSYEQQSKILSVFTPKISHHS